MPNAEVGLQEGNEGNEGGTVLLARSDLFCATSLAMELFASSFPLLASVRSISVSGLIKRSRASSGLASADRASKSM